MFDFIMNLAGDIGNWITVASLGTAAGFARKWLKDRMSDSAKDIIPRVFHVIENLDEVAETGTALRKWWNKEGDFKAVLENVEECEVLFEKPEKQKEEQKE